LRKKLSYVSCFIVVLNILWCCSMGWAAERLQVVTSVYPLEEFARAVGGERVTVKLLLPPGSEPHTWEPRPSDILSLKKAHIFIYIGAGMEPWIKDLLEETKKESLVVMEASDGLDLIHKNGNGNHHDNIGMDPHIWLDFRNDEKIIDRMVKMFSKMDPEGKLFYEYNGEVYKKKLIALDLHYSENLRNCKRSEILLGGHSAFSYMARRYDLEQIPLYGISPDAEPKPKEMADMIDFAKSHDVKAVYFERLINDRLATVIAEEIGAITLALNPGVNLTREERERGLSFISIMEENLSNLMKGLACE